ncbi:hypothetical protein TorRG33x02_037400 [Trema orientale]|uniref:Retrotransposon gag domain-containing protein n=1 Tax=Trema orientale TaxID=63057 RepID=A0A2P5FR97_TREOI|nr:hypothetical protein TorRG33x02_037400 [Trema orientale]
MKKHQTDEQKKNPSPLARLTNYTELIALIHHVFCYFRELRNLQEAKLHQGRSFEARSEYCRFHYEIGHSTTNCYVLRDKIEDLVHCGFLAEFVEECRNRPYDRNQETYNEDRAVTNEGQREI